MEKRTYWSVSGILIWVFSLSRQQPLPSFNLIVGGQTTSRGKWPWHILLNKKYNYNFIKYKCGGALIESTWVVTAAHCVDDGKETPRIFNVRVGEHNRTYNEGSEGDFQVSYIVRHPKYSDKATNNDIALLKLSNPVTFNVYVSKIYLPSKKVDPGTKCYVTGWGKISHPGRPANTLQETELSIVSNQQCQKVNGETLLVTDSMICGGDAGITNVSACHGDSGGPLSCQVNGRWELHGVLSWGSPICSSTLYTVFADVFKFKYWIWNEIGKCNPKCIHGTCIGNNHCRCDQGWMGQNCNSATCTPSCNHGNCSAPNVCKCDVGWKGEICSNRMDNPECVHGTCVANAGVNSCVCISYWDRISCATGILWTICYFVYMQYW